MSAITCAHGHSTPTLSPHLSQFYPDLNPIQPDLHSSSIPSLSSIYSNPSRSPLEVTPSVETVRKVSGCRSPLCTDKQGLCRLQHDDLAEESVGALLDCGLRWLYRHSHRFSQAILLRSFLLRLSESIRKFLG